MGPERLRVALQLALLGRAPADARGCTRLSGGIKQGSRQLSPRETKRSFAVKNAGVRAEAGAQEPRDARDQR